MRNDERPPSYWAAVARISFENDLNRLFETSGMNQADLAEKLGHSEAYVSQILNGKPRNYTIETLAKLARIFDGIVQIRIITEGEVVRIVDYETAGRLDDAIPIPVPEEPPPAGKVLSYSVQMNRTETWTEPAPPPRDASHGKGSNEMIVSGAING